MPSVKDWIPPYEILYKVAGAVQAGAKNAGQVRYALVELRGHSVTHALRALIKAGCIDVVSRRVRLARSSTLITEYVYLRDPLPSEFGQVTRRPPAKWRPTLPTAVELERSWPPAGVMAEHTVSDTRQIKGLSDE